MHSVYLKGAKYRLPCLGVELYRMKSFKRLEHNASDNVETFYAVLYDPIR